MNSKSSGKTYADFALDLTHRFKSYFSLADMLEKVNLVGGGGMMWYGKKIKKLEQII